MSEHLSKLLKKAHIVLDEQADILDAPLDHRKPVNAHAKGNAKSKSMVKPGPDEDTMASRPNEPPDTKM